MIGYLSTMKPKYLGISSSENLVQNSTYPPWVIGERNATFTAPIFQEYCSKNSSFPPCVNGVMNIVRNADSSERGICQNS